LNAFGALPETARASAPPRLRILVVVLEQAPLSDELFRPLCKQLVHDAIKPDQEHQRRHGMGSHVAAHDPR
jgi:hypothetical protein